MWRLIFVDRRRAMLEASIGCPKLDLSNKIKTSALSSSIVRIIPRAPIQDCLGTDRLCVLDVGIGTRDRHLEAISALVLDHYDYNFRVSLFRLFDIGSAVLVGFTQELKNTLNYQAV
ncbi:hypothetical protein J3E72DRAFT_265638 [Bipolaris maydis]|nr:hypothetical protein J3E72DRAFT_265638 [Bipolaris maydis]